MTKAFFFPIFIPFKHFFFACTPLYGIGLHSCWHVPSGVHDSGDFYFFFFELFPSLPATTVGKKMVHAL